MKKARMNTSHFRFIFFNFKFLAKQAILKKLVFTASLLDFQEQKEQCEPPYRCDCDRQDWWASGSLTGSQQRSLGYLLAKTIWRRKMLLQDSTNLPSSFLYAEYHTQIFHSHNSSIDAFPLFLFKSLHLNRK